MSPRTFVAAAMLVAAAVLSTVIVACSNPPPDCKAGTLRLLVQLNFTASLADTITVEANDPVVMQTFSRVPDGVYGEIASVDVAFPSGYPANKLITLLLRASAKGQTIGEDLLQIHLLPGCTVGNAVISTTTVDAAPPPQFD